MVYQIITLGLVGWILRTRDWRIRDINLEISWKLTFEGVFLWFIFFLIYQFVYSFILGTGILKRPYGDHLIAPLAVSILSSSTIILGQVVNAVYEEVLTVGYVLAALEDKKGTSFAINISVLLRFLGHLYQGPGAVIFIIPMGLLFTFVYAWRRQLWPLIVAHCMNNLIYFFTNVGGA